MKVFAEFPGFSRNSTVHVFEPGNDGPEVITSIMVPGVFGLML
jgi:hypothetical protein